MGKKITIMKLSRHQGLATLGKIMTVLEQKGIRYISKKDGLFIPFPKYMRHIK